MVRLNKRLGKYEVEIYKMDSDLYRLVPKKESKNFEILGLQLQNLKLAQITDIICTDTEIFLSFSGKFTELNEVLKSAKQLTGQAKSWKLPVRFTKSVDWQRVKDQTGLKRKEYIAELLKVEFKVAPFGFQPGFVYLKGLPKKLQVSRKATPVFNSIKNAFAVGGPYGGVYTYPSPAGWNVLGQLALPIFDLNEDAICVFNVGDTVRLVKISKVEFHSLQDSTTTDFWKR